MSRAGVREARVDDVDRLAPVIARAFADDPITTWIFGPPPTFEIALRILARDVYLPRGRIALAGDGAGAAMWLPPRAAANPSPYALLRFAFSVLPRVGVDRLRRVAGASATFARAKPRAPHLYLFALGVDSAARGRGFGVGLVRDGLAVADARGWPTYLETSRPENLRFYARLGFSIEREVILAPTAPKTWTMMREPAPA
ncbi:MAG: GNAT family N-acetyltransferase [Parvularculaceae bacterium]